MEIRNLRGVDFDTVLGAFERAFSDYEVRFRKAEIRALLKRRGFDPELSFAAFDERGIAAFTLNGIGCSKGLPTAYDTGTGTLKEYRGRGLAEEIFNYSIPYLQRAGIVQYLLEVLEYNTRALAVYRKLGFRETRRFDCFRSRADAVRCGAEKAVGICRIAPIDVGDLAAAAAFCDFDPSWQNSPDSIRRAGGGVRCLGAFLPSGLAGYCAFDPLSGDLTQIAVDPACRRRGIGSLLFREMLRCSEAEVVKALNVEDSCLSLGAFLRDKNMEVVNRQFEMVVAF